MNETFILLGLAGLFILAELYRWHVSFAFAGLDTDVILRLMRVSQIMNGGDWFNHEISSLHPVAGNYIHWSHAMDILLLILAYPLRFFVETSLSLEYAAVILTIILWIVFLFTVAWYLKQLGLSKTSQWIGIILFNVTANINAMFILGRGADHHALLAILFVASLGFCLRLFAIPVNNNRGRCAAVLGVICAIGIWVSVEFSMVYAAIVSVFGIFWIIQNNPSYLYLMRVVATVTFSISVPLFFIENRWGQWQTPINHLQYSYLYIGYLAIVAAASVMLGALEKQSFVNKYSSRIIALCLTACAGAAAAFYLDPLITKGFMAETDSLFRAIGFNSGEMMPFITIFLKTNTGLFFVVILALAIAAFTTKNIFDKNHWWFMLVMAIVTVALTLISTRWVRYSFIVLIPLATIPLSNLVNFIKTANAGQAVKRNVRNWIMPIWIFGILVFACVQDYQSYLNSGATSYAELPRLAFNGDLKKLMPEQGTVFSYDQGAYVAYKTDHASMIGPYPPNTTGTCDSLHFLNTKDQVTVKNIIRKYDIKYITLKEYDFSLPEFFSGLVGYGKASVETKGCKGLNLISPSNGQNSYLYDIFIGRIKPDWLSLIYESKHEGSAGPLRIYRVGD